MAGHSKWANIRHRKKAQDAKKGKLFTKVVREISIAVKEGKSSDPCINYNLRTAISNAKGVNVPKDTIEKAIKKASEINFQNYQEITFEGYAPHGVAVFIECVTDNNNRTVSNIRSIFNKHGGSLGKKGEISFLFERKGVFTINTNLLNTDSEELELFLIEEGAEEIESRDNYFLVITSYEKFGSMQRALEKKGVETTSVELQKIPIITKKLDSIKTKKILDIIEKFEEDDDVQQVFHNMEISE